MLPKSRNLDRLAQRPNYESQAKLQPVNTPNKSTHYTTGLSQVERNRFENLKDHVRRLRARPEPEGHGPGAVKKMLEEFCLQYTYPQCPEPRYIRGKSDTSVY